MKSLLSPLIAALGIAAASVATTASHAEQLPQDHRIPGGIAVIELGQQATAPKVTFKGKPVFVYAHGGADGQAPDWTAVVGIPLTTQPGRSEVSVNNKKQSFEVQAHAYKEQRLTVENKHVNPSEESLQRYRREAAEMGKVFTSFSAAQSQTWPNMIWPAQGPLSSPFGLRRFFNGEERNPHSGLDIAAPRGADIIAPADGVVGTTGDYFFNGNTVMLDHGQGLISMFCHMDRIDVQPGQKIRQGDKLGIVGATGRATGPHLHWSLSLNNARVDPLLVLPPHQDAGHH